MARQAQGPRAPSNFGAFGHRNFRLYFGGHLLSLIGWSMHGIAQPWLILVLTDSPFYVGLISMLGTLPILLLSLYGGMVADRFPKRRVLLMTQSMAMLIALVLATVVLLDAVKIGHVMAAATLLGIAAAFDIPGRQSFLVDLVGKPDLMSAIAFNSAAFNGSRIVGPAVAGVLIGFAGVGICFLVNGVSYLALLGALLVMRLPHWKKPAESENGRSTIRDGLVYVAGDRRMRTLLLMIATTSILGFPYHILMPVLARSEMGLGSTQFGWMVSAAATGALVAALGLATVARGITKGKVIAVAAPLFGLFVSALGFARSFPILLALLVMTGFFQVVFTATVNTTLQGLVRDDFRGRVMSVYTLAFLGLLPLGSLSAGIVADRFGATVWLSTAGMVCAVVVTTLIWRAPEVRRIV